MTPPARHPRTWLAALGVAAVTAGCGNGARLARNGEVTAQVTSDPSVERALRSPRIARMFRRCRVTQANHSTPPGEPKNSVADYYGNGRLWTVLSPRGVLVAGAADLQRDGSISRKFPWWRQVHGDLRIAGRRLGARTARLRARIPSGYGPTGFQSSAIVFPTEGCWQVTGKVGNAQLTYVTLVVKALPQ